MRRYFVLGLLLAIGGCSSFRSRPEPELMPVPRSPIDLAAEISRYMDMDPGVQEFFDEEAEALADSIAAEARFLQEDSLIQEQAAREASEVIAGGLLKDRFRDARRAPANWQRDDFSRTINEEERERVMEWVRTDVIEDSLDLGQPWERVNSVWRRGTRVEGREMVWPTPITILRKEPGNLQVATEWINGTRLPWNELRCLNAEGQLTERARRVRLVGAMVPGTMEGVRIRAGIEVDSDYHCGLSLQGEARVSAFVRDLWLSTYRLSADETGAQILY